MPKFVRKLITKLQKHSRKPREGYFVLFFAIVVTMLMLPVLSSVLTTTVETRSQVANYYRAETARNQGESVLFNKLETLSREHGLGYFEQGDVFLDDEEAGTTLPDEERPRVTYKFSAASVTTTPSKYSPDDLNVPTEADNCTTWMNEDGDRLSFEGCEDEPSLESLPGETDPYYYYTVPALGTGDVGGADCELGKINLDYYPEVEGVTSDFEGQLIDPLDHPCSWNQLSLGQNVGIPLYVNTSESPDRYEVFIPESLTLRVRFKCNDFEDTYCLPEQRLFITHDEISELLKTEPNPRQDITPRVLDWAIQGAQIILPDQRGDFSELSGRRIDSIEITIQRLYQFTFDPTKQMFKLFSSIPNLGYSTINFMNNEASALLISDAFDRDATANPLSSFFESVETGLLTSPEPLSPSAGTAYGVTEDAPVLNLGFLNAYFEGCLPGTDNCKTITEIEYQLISDVPLGNHKFVITGISKNLNSTYALMKAEKSGPEVTTIPGTVFGS